MAPISGRAGAVQVKTGSLVRENDTTLVTLLQLAPIYVTFGIPEQSLPEVQRLNALAPLISTGFSTLTKPRRGQLQLPHAGHILTSHRSGKCKIA